MTQLSTGPWETLLGRSPSLLPATYTDLSSVDTFGPNPMAEMLKLQQPDVYAAVSKVVAPPKMFAAGKADVPVFTASAVEPQELLKMPFGVRHSLAMEPDIGKVYEGFELYADQPDALIPVPALVDAAHRLLAWLATDIRTPEDIAREDAEHQQLMGQLGFTPGADGGYSPTRVGLLG